MINACHSMVAAMKNIVFLFLKFGNYVPENKEKKANKTIRCIPGPFVISTSYLLKSKK